MGTESKPSSNNSRKKMQLIQETKALSHRESGGSCLEELSDDCTLRKRDWPAVLFWLKEAGLGREVSPVWRERAETGGHLGNGVET